MKLTLATAPTTDPVSLAEVRRWLNFTEGLVEEDAVLEALIDECYDYLENWTNRKMLGQTWTLTLDESEVSSKIRLPLVPLQSVSSIVTTDDDGDTTTVTSSNYQVRAGEDPRIVLTDDGEWPTDMRDYDSMAITCVCGYGGDVLPFVGYVPTSYRSPGLDDMRASLSAAFSGTAKTTFEIEITAEATPDKFKWRKVTRDSNGTKTYGSYTTDVSITGAAQTLADNVQITFAATTGHTSGDAWTVQVYEKLPLRVTLALRSLVLFFYSTKGRGVSETVSGQLIGMPRQLQHLLDSLRVEAW